MTASTGLSDRIQTSLLAWPEETRRTVAENLAHLVTEHKTRCLRVLGHVEPIPEKVRFHDLRHTVASLLLSKGHSLKAVSQRLGHANPTMTLRVYAHTMPNDDAKLAEGLARMMA